MNSLVTYSQSALAHPAPGPTRADVRPEFLTNFRLRQIAGDVAMLLALIAFVLTFAALRFTLFAPPGVVERVLIPAAAGAAVVSVLGLLCSIALRYGNTAGPSR